jgi:WD40 repeat protein
MVPGLAVIILVLGGLDDFAVNLASSDPQHLPVGLSLIYRHPIVWWLGFTIIVAVLSTVVWAVQQHAGVRRATRQFELPDYVVRRPEQLDEVVEALGGWRKDALAHFIVLHGAGGFGKTTLARMVAGDQRIAKAFPGGVFWLTVGRDVRDDSAVLGKINWLIREISDDERQSMDVETAGQRLGGLLDSGPRRLVILDDVWFDFQLEPFMHGGRQCSRLVTTRSSTLLGTEASYICVNQMSSAQARFLLTSGIESMDPAVTTALLAVTGGWALLLHLVNKLLRRVARSPAEVTRAGRELHEKLSRVGPQNIDQLMGTPVSGLDVNVPAQRARAVRTTIEASTSLMDRDSTVRFGELTVFVEDAVIPFGLIALLWAETGGLDVFETRALCAQLDELGLVSKRPDDSGDLTLHDVIRDYLIEDLGHDAVPAVHATLLDVVAQRLANSSSVDAEPRAWWTLHDTDDYLWDHVIEHLLVAERRDEAESLAGDLRWVLQRLSRFGPVAPYTDLMSVGTPRCAHLADVIAKAAHLLTPTQPSAALADILCSRVGHVPEWGHQIAQIRAEHGVGLSNRWALPDLPDPALRRVLVGHTDAVLDVAVAPDGRWIASASADGSVRIWSPSTGQAQLTLVGHTGPVQAVAISPGSAWLASYGSDKTVRVWDPLTGAQLAITPMQQAADKAEGRWKITIPTDGPPRVSDHETGHTVEIQAGSAKFILTKAGDGQPEAVACGDVERQSIEIRHGDGVVARRRGHNGAVRVIDGRPDDDWFVSAGSDGTLRIWDRIITQGMDPNPPWAQVDAVHAVAAAPHGGWVASVGSDSELRIWDPHTGQLRFGDPGRIDPLTKLAVLQGGGLLASAGEDGMIRTWKCVTDRNPNIPTNAASWLGNVQYTPVWNRPAWQIDKSWHASPSPIRALSAAIDGTWISSVGDDPTIRIWDFSEMKLLYSLVGQQKPVLAVAVSPDGRLMASAGYERTTFVWDLISKKQVATLAGHTGTVRCLTFSSDGTWIASGGDDRTVKVWSAFDLKGCIDIGRHAASVAAIAPSTDPDRLATVSTDRTLRIWSINERAERALMRVDADLLTCAWTDDAHGTGLLCGGGAGLYAFDCASVAESAVAP